MPTISKPINTGAKKLNLIIEAIAVVSGLLYTYLYIKMNPWCWFFAALSAGLFVYLCYAKKIYAEVVLQLFYIGFAIYGFSTMDDGWGEATWSLQKHLIWIGLGAAGMWAGHILLKKYTNAKATLLDSFTTSFSLVATIVMVAFVHENWLYWIVIDTVAIFLYYKRGMYFGSVLFLIYLVLSILGYLNIQLPL